MGENGGVEGKGGRAVDPLIYFPAIYTLIFIMLLSHVKWKERPCSKGWTPCRLSLPFSIPFSHESDTLIDRVAGNNLNGGRSHPFCEKEKKKEGRERNTLIVK